MTSYRTAQVRAIARRQYIAEQRARLELWAASLMGVAAGQGFHQTFGFLAALRAAEPATARQLHALAAELWQIHIGIARHFGFSNLPPAGCGRCTACVSNQRTATTWRWSWPCTTWNTCQACDICPDAPRETEATPEGLRVRCSRCGRRWVEPGQTGYEPAIAWANQQAAARLASEDERDVHTEHCCREHGCKYGDDECTVFVGRKAQSFPCEDCDADAAGTEGVQ